MTGDEAQRMGHMIAIARRNKGWSTRRLSLVTGINHTWLSKLQQGEYLTPAPDRLTKVAEALGIDPKRFERIAKGHVADSLPGVRTYFRAKYDLSQEEIDTIERTVNQIQRNHERSKAHDNDSHTTRAKDRHATPRAAARTGATPRTIARRSQTDR